MEKAYHFTPIDPIHDHKFDLNAQGTLISIYVRLFEGRNWQNMSFYPYKYDFISKFWPEKWGHLKYKVIFSEINSQYDSYFAAFVDLFLMVIG